MRNFFALCIVTFFIFTARGTYWGIIFKRWGIPWCSFRLPEADCPSSSISIDSSTKVAEQILLNRVLTSQNMKSGLKGLIPSNPFKIKFESWVTDSNLFPNFWSGPFLYQRHFEGLGAALQFTRSWSIWVPMRRPAKWLRPLAEKQQRIWCVLKASFNWQICSILLSCWCMFRKTYVVMYCLKTACCFLRLGGFEWLALRVSK